MSVVFVCDGCGKQVSKNDGSKPAEWFSKTVSRKESEYSPITEVIHACSRNCIEKASAAKKTDSVVFPI